MKRFSIIMILLALTALITPAAVMAQASTTSWTSSITYYAPSASATACPANGVPGTGNDSLSVTYYAGTTSYNAGPFCLAAHKAGSLLIGTTSVAPGFSGSAVVSSTTQVMVTYVQFASGTDTNFGRMINNGFDSSQAGSPFYVPTFLYQPGVYKSQVGVQNINQGFIITATLSFFPAGGGAATTKSVDIAPSAAYIFMGNDIAGLPNPFNGSLKITAVQKGTSTAASVVATSEEMQENGRRAYSFEGMNAGANLIYMPSMLCNSGSTAQTSFYAIQNAANAGQKTTIVADFYDTTGAKITTYTFPTAVDGGGKASINPCSGTGMNGKSGSAVIRSTGDLAGTSAQPLLAIGKVTGNDGLSTAFIGQAAGAKNVALPYVRWSANPASDFRTFIAIMNVGDNPATNIVANYYNNAGQLVKSHVIASSASPLGKYIKRNSSAQAAGALVNNAFGTGGGAVEIISDQPVVVTARSQKTITGVSGFSDAGEDYNGITFTP